MSAVVRTALDIASNVGARIEHTVNRLLPPKQRERAVENLRVFSSRNPKFASFLAAQTALAGLPILLFIAFAVATLAVSLITCVVLGVVVALVFTLFTTGLALLFVVPVVLLGSCTASIAFLWGLVGYLVLQRISGNETPTLPCTEVGDVLNEQTDGRLRSLVGGADAGACQERLAVGSSQDQRVPMRRESVWGDDKTRGGLPRGQYYGQTNGSSYGGKAGEASEESRTRGAQVGTRDYPQVRMGGQSPAVETAVNWKSEFQQEGLTA